MREISIAQGQDAKPTTLPGLAAIQRYPRNDKKAPTVEMLWDFPLGSQPEPLLSWRRIVSEEESPQVPSGLLRGRLRHLVELEEQMEHLPWLR